MGSEIRRQVPKQLAKEAKSHDITSVRIDTRVEWECDRGHKWEAKLAQRLNGSGCPYCDGQRPVVGLNDLATTHPELIAKEWDWAKNTKKPSELMRGSSYKAWWLCEKGHSWQKSLLDKTRYFSTCYYCSNRKVLVGYNDLSTTHPEVAKDWTSNNDIGPHEVTKVTHRKAHWLCSAGHNATTSVRERVRSGGCPSCFGRVITPGFNDLATVSPEIAATWHPTKNGLLTPTEVAPHSAKDRWWQCNEGHEWRTQVNNRSNGRGCPFCFGYKRVVGVTDLATTHPDVVKGWDYEMNKVSPQEIGKGYARKVWWKCPTGKHSYLTQPINRVLGKGCPYCANKVLLTGFNDFATTHTEMAKEWNDPKDPKLLRAAESVSVRWKCKEGHEWASTLRGRTTKNSGCPECYKGGTSRAESMFRESFRRYLSEVNTDHKSKISVGGSSYQVDIFGTLNGVPIAIEYDGYRWHDTEKKRLSDKKTTKALLDAGYFVVRIREGALALLDMKHPRLAQHKVKWSATQEGADNSVDEIVARLKKRKCFSQKD